MLFRSSPDRACDAPTGAYGRRITEALVSWSLHQRDAPIAARECFAACLPQAVERGALALVTCHRVEVFACLPTDVDPRTWLRCSHEASDGPDAVVVRTEAAAVTHLFRVAAGLDSAIAGERQILGQLRRAYTARAMPLPSLLSAAVERALHHGRLLRAETALGSVTRSIGSLAVDELLRELHEPDRATILVVGAGLLAKSLYRLLHVDTGFNVQQLAVLSVSPGSVPAGSPKENEPTRALAQQAAERVAAVPGVLSVGYADLLPLAPGLAPTSTFWVPGRSEHDQLKEEGPVRRVSPAYFRTLQAAVLRGREFTSEDVASARPVMIINDTAARRSFRGDDPIGRSIALGGSGSPLREIVGVVADIKDGPPESPPLPAAYVPFDQSAFTLVVRTAPAEHTVFPSIVAAVQQVQPGLSLSGQTTMSEQLRGLPSTSLNRSSTWLVGGFASIAFVLGVVGLYGVVAYTVAQRTREIGVRMALGAQPRSVYRLVLGQAGRLVSLGTVIGLVSAVGLATLMRHLLFDVESWDLATLAAASTGLIVSALLASYLPARRAASVNPVEALRAE